MNAGVPTPCRAAWWGRGHRGHQNPTAGGHSGVRCRAQCRGAGPPQGHLQTGLTRDATLQRGRSRPAPATGPHAPRVPLPLLRKPSPRLESDTYDALGPSKLRERRVCGKSLRGDVSEPSSRIPCLPRSAGWDRLWRRFRNEFQMTWKESRAERGFKAPAPPRGVRTREGSESRWLPILAQEPGDGRAV